MAPIITKNFGHTYLKYILASCVLNNLFIDGAISKDWYKIIGNDSAGDVNSFDPDLVYNLGSKLIFEVNAPGHPFLIKDQAGTGKKNSVKEIEKNGLSKGIIEWEPKQKGTYYYQCIKHKNMVGKIIIK